jgi:AcrR family transcriptional regulator
MTNESERIAVTGAEPLGGPGAEPGGGPATAAALLAAGRALFSERGYDGASVRAITAHACANLGAITYHFGSKRELYDRVVEDCILPLVERVEAVARGEAPCGEPGDAPVPAAHPSLSALDRIELVVRAFYEHLRALPELPRLLVRELAEGGGPPAAVVGPLRRLYQALVALVGEGQARGEIRGGDPLVLVVSVVAQPIHYGLVGPDFVRIFGQDPDDPAHRAEIVRSAVTFVRAGLATGGGR